jgi:hypothetical protein
MSYDEEEARRHREHWHRHPEHHRHSRFVDIIITNRTHYLTKEINMSTVTLIDGQAVVGTLGSTRDDNGEVTADAVVAGSATWTSDDTTLGTTLTVAADTLSASLAVPAGTEAGTVNITVAATTAAGAAVTGAAVATINAPPVGAAVTVDIDWGTPA